MTTHQKRLVELSTSLPDGEDRAACLAGAEAIERLREIAVQSAGWDEFVIRLQQASHHGVPVGDY